MKHLGIAEDAIAFILTRLHVGRSLWEWLWNPRDLGSRFDIPTHLGDLLNFSEPHFPPL